MEMNMSVRKMGRSWWIDFRFNRARYRRKSPENSRAGALNYEILVRQKLARGESLETIPEVKAQTFAEFASEWMKVYVRTNNKRSEQRAKMFTMKNHLISFFGRLPLEKIDSTLVEQYKSQKISEHLSPKTINNHLTVLAKCLNTARDWGRIEKSLVVKHLKTTSQRLDFLSPTESQQLIEQAEYPMWGEMVFLALRTGLRIGELIGLEWQDVDFKHQQLTVQHSVVNGIVGTPKNGKVRHLPLTEDVCKALYELRKPKGRVFVHPDGLSLSHSMARRAIQRMCKQAGVRKISWHILRHTFASQLVSRGVPLTAVKELLGHSTITMT